ncbi:MAG: TraV family lipoprotein [Microbacteriaceae bacterium]|nr:TraV family lipoprotein [Microbacteriaceae bacterium]
MIRGKLLTLAVTTALAGCASSMSGVGGTGTYGCKAPEGSQCTSVSGVYANARHGSMRPTTTPANAEAYGAPSIAPQMHNPSSAPAPSLRSSPRVLRLWIAPWEDRDGDLHEESIVHVIVDTGRWLIEHVRPNRRAPFDAVAPPAAPTDAQTPQPATGDSIELERLSLPPRTTTPSTRPAQ